MSIINTGKAAVTNFRGAWLRQDSIDVPPKYALYARNSEFNIFQVSKRTGFGEVWNPNEAITSLFNWIKNEDIVSTGGSSLYYYSATAGKLRRVGDLGTPSPQDVYTVSAYSAVCASGGSRLYVTFFNPSAFSPTPIGVGHLIVLAVFGAEVDADRAFLGPQTTALSITGAGSGNVTQGVHRIGYIITSRTGFAGKLSPVTGADSEYDISSVLTADATDQSFTVTLDTSSWPTEANSVQLFMSPVDDLNRYFLIPGGSLGVSGGTLNFTVDVSDEDLYAIAAEAEVTDHLNLLTQDSSGNPPFSPFFVFEYGQRMGYMEDTGSIAGAVSTCWFSDPEDPQHLSADQHGVTLPGFRKMCAAFVIRNVCYILGPNWTYAVQATADVPVEWPAPALVDGQIGTLSPHGVTVNTAGGFAWVVSQRGLELFSAGAYGTRPMSYYQETDWKRINFAQAHKIQIVDDSNNQQILVIVPLDGATTCTHILCFDYKHGLTPKDIDYSIWDIDSFLPGAIGLVRNPTSYRMEPWLGRSSVGAVLRKNQRTDSDPFQDNGAAVVWQHRLGILPRAESAPGRQWTAQSIYARVTGAGTLVPSVRSLDGVKEFTLRSIPLTSAPGLEYFRGVPRGVNSEGFEVTFSESTLDGYCDLSLFEMRYSPFLIRRNI